MRWISIPFARKLSRHPVAVILLGSLAVDLGVQGQGWGEGLLIDTVEHVGELEVAPKETIVPSLEKVPGGLAVVPGKTRDMVITAGDGLAGSDQAVMSWEQGAFCIHDGPEERLTVLRTDHHNLGDTGHHDGDLVFVGCIK
jgi:hypothetical protein